MPSPFAIGAYPFENWHGDPPHLPQEQIAAFTRPGADGVGEVLLGSWGDPITCEVISHHDTYANAWTVLNALMSLPGSGLVEVTWNYIDVNTTSSVQYYVDHVTLVTLEKCVLLHRAGGDGYTYWGGAKMRTRFRLRPEDVS